MYRVGAQAADSVADCRADDGTYTVVDPLFESFASEQHIPGMIYGIVRGGQLVHCRGLGVGQVESGQPVNIDTVFRIASMTKSVTALAVLKLRDAGKLSLDDTAARWVPQLGKNAGPDADIVKIRVADLLAHTAGFVTDDPWADRQLAMPEVEFSKMISAGIPMVRAPGVGFEYSNYGYALLGRIVSNASGVRYQDYVRSQFLQPLGMKSSGWQAADIDAKRRAHGYRYEDGAWREEPVLADGAFAAIGGLHTSARDYVAYVDFLLSAWGDRGAANSAILSPQSRRQLAQATSHPGLSAARPADPSSCATAGVYGLGMGIYKDCRFDLAV
ncbi:serine hydrolase domain-containing protein, partial [Steroidobacter sp.]|uniref:serine hydrolase domain-containing protein n=1 Tax=Steroidobacter sp. TaxID=1978227 RepID=UPI001A62D6DE